MWCEMFLLCTGFTATIQEEIGVLDLPPPLSPCCWITVQCRQIPGLSYFVVHPPSKNSPPAPPSNQVQSALQEKTVDTPFHLKSTWFLQWNLSITDTLGPVILFFFGSPPALFSFPFHLYLN